MQSATEILYILLRSLQEEERGARAGDPFEFYRVKRSQRVDAEKPILTSSEQDGERYSRIMMPWYEEQLRCSLRCLQRRRLVECILANQTANVDAWVQLCQYAPKDEDLQGIPMQVYVVGDQHEEEVGNGDKQLKSGSERRVVRNWQFILRN